MNSTRRLVRRIKTVEEEWLEDTPDLRDAHALEGVEPDEEIDADGLPCRDDCDDDD